MNKFKESLKIEVGNMQNIALQNMTEKEKIAYEEHNRKRFANEVHKPIWKVEEK